MNISTALVTRAATASVLALALGATGAASGFAAPRAAATASASSTARTVDATSYADALVRAWGAGDKARASGYATPSVLATLFGEANPGGKHWWRTGEEGAAGTIYVSYRNGSSSQTLTIGVSNVGLSEGKTHDAYRASFG